MSTIDHLVYAAPSLEMGVQQIEKLTGARVSPGGVHAGRGTHNALLSLGKNCYLEIIAPDSEQQNSTAPLWMGLDKISRPQLTRWAVKTDNLEALATKAKQQKINIGKISEGWRQLPGGKTLRWQLSDPEGGDFVGALPFFIDWKNAPHPEQGLNKDCQLLDLTIAHPEAKTLKQSLLHLGLDFQVLPEDKPSFSAKLQTPRGVIFLS